MKTPRAYYNENDPFAAHWLYNLIQARLIAAGDIDTRDIRTVKPGDLAGYTQCHFFAGIGGWSLALRLAGIDDRYPIWTGSCPCQPFSAAGKRQGFADDRHLWPVWRTLIEKCRPSIIFGEQVASAAQWLRLVRGDLEGLDYAVGAMPVEAASAGADHLRDRYWFVAYGAQQQHGGRHAGARGRDEHSNGSGNVALAYSSSTRLQIGECNRRVQRQEVGASEGQTTERDGVAHADLAERGIGDEQPAGQFPQQQQSEACDSSDVGDAFGAGAGRHSSSSSTRPQAKSGCERLVDGHCGDASFASDSNADYTWVIGADGKARRVKRGIRLLAHAVSGRLVVRRAVQQGAAEVQEEHWYNRVGALKGFGNAIDPPTAAAFIKSAIEALGDLTPLL